MNDRQHGLEKWYRRLLVAYPAGHRRQHGQEMLDVILADADGREQRRPSLRESADLLSGGLRIRVRRLTFSFRTTLWRDTLAVISLIGPLILLAHTARVLNTMTAALIPEHYPGHYPWEYRVVQAPQWLGWPVALALAFWGGPSLARIAQLLAAALAIGAVYQTCLAAEPNGGAAIGLGYAILQVVSALTFAASPGPRRGLAVLEKVDGRLTIATAATIFLSEALAPLENILGVNYRNITAPWYSWTWGLILIAPLVGSYTPSGRRTAALLATPILFILAFYSVLHVPNGTPATHVLLFTATFAAPMITGGLLFLLLAFARRSHTSL